MFISRYDRDWVVDMDLFKCYDTLDHDIIIAQYRKQVCDGRVLKLLLALLGSGKMVGDSRETTTIGSLQGGVISPLIANVYLDNFDQFMKSRDYRIIRDADDILTLCRSETAAQNALKVASRYF